MQNSNTIFLPLKYSHADIVFQEVPGEIALVFNITGCPHHCSGCHSEYLWDYKGSILNCNVIATEIQKYRFMITCVCFMGGDQNCAELRTFCQMVQSKYDLKTCIYSGLDYNDFIYQYGNLNYVNYLKTGPYKKALGGLSTPGTNQRFFKVRQDKSLEDLTYKFQQKVY
jgi:anaerobic ribonucleoside-triphosphate reductase activating protein